MAEVLVTAAAAAAEVETRELGVAVMVLSNARRSDAKEWSAADSVTDNGREAGSRDDALGCMPGGDDTGAMSDGNGGGWRTPPA